MFSRLWLTVVLSFLFYVIYLPSCESSFLLHLICPWLNITWLCSQIPEYAYLWVSRYVY
uniref:Uncharacterized protein n=1 Tax=Trichobilharzia regenti TaxID=157069 RepID=A0AA85IY67_TRIRE|nr:unnamed protein product [Trichobilharzia regenti]